MRRLWAKLGAPGGWLVLWPVVAAFLAHGGALWSGYVLFDDREMLLEHPQLDAITAWPRLFFRDYFEHAGHHHGMYRPLALCAYAWDRAWWGANPVGFHLTNLLIHAATAVGVASLMSRLGLRWRWAVFGGCLFAINPVHAETVGWIVGRCDGIATLGAVVALAAHLAGRPWLAAGALLFGLGGKESAAAVVPLALLLAWAGYHPPGNDRPRAWKRAISAMAVAVAGYTVLRFAALGAGHFLPSSFGQAGNPMAQLWLPERLAVFGRSAACMFQGMASGVGLCADHSPSEVWRFPRDYLYTPAGGVLAGLSAITFLLTLYYAKRGALVLVGMAWIGVSWLPVAQLSPLRVVQADRFCSLASVGWALALVAACAGLVRWLDRTRRGGIIIAWMLLGAPFLCFFYGLQSWRRTGAFAGVEAHARDVLARYPLDAQAYNRLGIYYDELQGGDRATQAAYADAARRAYAEAFAITSGRKKGRGRPAPSSYMNYGTLQLEIGDFGGARWTLEAALRRYGPSPKLRRNLGVLYYKTEHYGLAEEQLRPVVARWPLAAGRLLARTLAAQGEHAEAIRYYERALAQSPGDARLHQGIAESLLARQVVDPPAVDRALQHALRAVARYDTWPQGQLTLGRVMIAAKDVAGARAALRTAAERGEGTEAGDAADALLKTLKNQR